MLRTRQRNRQHADTRLSDVTAITAALAIALLMLAGAAQAESVCGEALFCVADVPTDAGIDCVAENRSATPITFTLKVSAAHQSGRRDRIATRIIAADESFTVFSIEPRGNGRSGEYCYNYRSTIGDMNAAHDDEHIYRFPYESGKSYGVLQGYGSRFSHTGRERYSVDFNMPEGTRVLAARNGIVAAVEESHSIGCWDDDCGKYANFVVIVHADGTTGEYYHLQQNGALVEIGERVEAGQHIALSGNTGHTTMPHLHFGVYRPESWGRYQSIPVRFISADGIVDRPRRGGRYQAISLQRANTKYGKLPSVLQFNNQESTL